MSTFSFGQVCGPSTNTVYEKISKTELKVISNNECDTEIGHVRITKDDKIIRHGMWNSYCNGILKMSALFKDGKLIWVETDTQKRITYAEIVYLRNIRHDNTTVAENSELDDQ
jgi:hypothetical protein